MMMHGALVMCPVHDVKLNGSVDPQMKRIYNGKTFSRFLHIEWEEVVTPVQGFEEMETSETGDMVLR